MQKHKYALCAALILAVVSALVVYPHTSCKARVYIDITSPSLRKIPTAVPFFKDLNPKDKQSEFATTLADLLAETIDFTGFFKILDREAFLENPQESDLTEHGMNFKNWTDIGAELLIKGGFECQGDRLKVEIRLFDAFSGRLMLGKRYKGHPEDHRQIIRRFCNDIVKLLTGHEGIFNTQIAFISNTSGQKEVYLADFDGHNPRQFTDTGTITLSPAWSSDGRYVAYTDFTRGKADLYVRNIREQQGTVISFSGSSIAPAWMPGKFSLAASLSHEGNPALYLLTGKGKIIEKLTDHWGIDVSPTWSPDGKALAFVSDRSGSPQIHIKNMKSGEVRRLTYEGNYNTSPQWSPRGNYIAYTGFQKNGHIDIYIITPEGEGPIQLTENAGNNESPTWSSDGSLIAFSSTREGVSRIYVMNANGANQRRLLVLNGEQTSPSWSPRLSK